MNKDYYRTLGVERDAEPNEIKKAYRKLSKEHHPDHGGDEEKFKEINEAYSVLSDPNKKAEYDNPMRNMGSPFEDMFSRFSGPFGPRPRPRHDPNAPKKGRNIRLQHEAPIHIFVLGGNIKVSFDFNDVCGDCKGRGAQEFDKCTNCNGTGMITQVRSGQGVHIQSAGPCPVCGGRGGTPKESCQACEGLGHVEESREVVLPIPPGFRDGQVAGAAGQGGRGLNGGPSGDLIVKIIMKYPSPEQLTEEQKELLEEL